jgi:hypothetical protein
MNPPEPSTQSEITQEVPLPSPPPPSVQPARTPTRVIRRKAILSDDSVPGKDTPAVSNLTYTVQQQAGPGANQRRQRQVLKQILVVVLANNLLIAGGVVWFVYSSFADIESQLRGSSSVQHNAAPSPAVAPSTIDTEAIEKRASTLEAKLSQQITDLQKKLSESTQQAEAAQKQREATEQKLDELTRRVAGVASEVQDHEKAAPPPTADPAASAIANSENKNTPELPPSQAELVLLKERNRLTAYADEAIASGSRDAYEQLWKAISDPRLTNLTHAARAEILRVQECYLNGQRAKYYGIQQYQIPIADLLPDAASLTPAQLTDDQLIQILADQKAPWQARVKAAWYLGRHRSTKVGDALVKAVKEDPMLDVEAEATYSFEQVTGYRSKLFEPDNLEAWWDSYKAAPAPNDAAKSDNKNAAPDKKSAKPEKGADDHSKSAPEQVKKPLKPEDKDAGKDKDKDDKKKNEKQPNIPLREPDEKP